ncbi:MAG: hypothetical protein HY461_02690 [Parcubacteria group bacterium]|nr:hypothetical protein [Parcubacteria group bacterium]
MPSFERLPPELRPKAPVPPESKKTPPRKRRLEGPAALAVGAAALVTGIFAEREGQPKRPDRQPPAPATRPADTERPAPMGWEKPVVAAAPAEPTPEAAPQETLQPLAAAASTPEELPPSKPLEQHQTPAPERFLTPQLSSQEAFGRILEKIDRGLKTNLTDYWEALPAFIQEKKDLDKLFDKASIFLSSADFDYFLEQAIYQITNNPQNYTRHGIMTESARDYLSAASNLLYAETWDNPARRQVVARALNLQKSGDQFHPAEDLRDGLLKANKRRAREILKDLESTSAQPGLKDTELAAADTVREALVTFGADQDYLDYFDEGVRAGRNAR